MSKSLKKMGAALSLVVLFGTAGLLYAQNQPSISAPPDSTKTPEQTPTGEQVDAWQAARRTFERFERADEYLFTVPMWNAGVPWVLKHLIDTITQPGLVFGFDSAQGYIPLLEGKRAVAVYTSGVYSPGAPIQFGSDFHAEFFSDWLRFIGVEVVSEIRFQPTVLTADPDAAREAALARARELAAELTAPAAQAA